MSKLTDAQLIVLSSAAQRDDGAAHLPGKMPKAAVLKLGAALTRKKLMREVRSKPDMPVWRRDDEDRPKSLVILKAGRQANNVDDAGAHNVAPTGIADKSFLGSSRLSRQLAGSSDAMSAATEQADCENGGLGSTSKRARIIGMLSDADGATIESLARSTGWLPHTMRSFLTGLRKSGFALERQRPDGAAASIYRIIGQPVNAG